MDKWMLIARVVVILIGSVASVKVDIKEIPILTGAADVIISRLLYFQRKGFLVCYSFCLVAGAGIYSFLT